jgi:hypothetical protein
VRGKKKKKHYENGRYSRGGISFMKYHVLIQNKNPKCSYPVAHKQIPVKGTEKYEWVGLSLSKMFRNVYHQ